YLDQTTSSTACSWKKMRATRSSGSLVARAPRRRLSLQLRTSDARCPGFCPARHVNCIGRTAIAHHEYHDRDHRVRKTLPLRMEPRNHLLAITRFDRHTGTGNDRSTIARAVVAGNSRLGGEI